MRKPSADTGQPPTDKKAAERYPRRTARREQTRARILRAAFAEFRRVGYADATMNAIADAANIHVTTLFTHFRTKRHLAETLAENELHILQNLISNARGKTPIFEFFRALVLKQAEERQTKGDHKRGMIGKSLEAPELALNWMRYEERQVRLIADYIAADFGLDPKKDYAPMLAADILISSGVISYRRWARNPQASDLIRETRAALDLAERMARAVLPPHPSC